MLPNSLKQWCKFFDSVNAYDTCRFTLTLDSLFLPFAHPL